jgi:hypothetical protein
MKLPTKNIQGNCCDKCQSDYVDLDFLEIGTSNFRTLIQSATDETFVMSVEPISYYLNQLPDKKHVIKLNYAISFDNSEGEVDIYYIPENVIDENGLPALLKGCNCLNQIHPIHEQFNVSHLVRNEPLPKVKTENVVV